MPCHQAIILADACVNGWRELVVITASLLCLLLLFCVAWLCARASVPVLRVGVVAVQLVTLEYDEEERGNDSLRRAPVTAQHTSHPALTLSLNTRNSQKE
jgi:hypothetical protein